MLSLHLNSTIKREKMSSLYFICYDYIWCEFQIYFHFMILGFGVQNTFFILPFTYIHKKCDRLWSSKNISFPHNENSIHSIVQHHHHPDHLKRSGACNQISSYFYDQVFYITFSTAILSSIIRNQAVNNILHEKLCHVSKYFLNVLCE